MTLGHHLPFSTVLYYPLPSPTVPYRPPPSPVIPHCFLMYPTVFRCLLPSPTVSNPPTIGSYLLSPGRSCLWSWGSSSLLMTAILGIQRRGWTTSYIYNDIFSLFPFFLSAYYPSFFYFYSFIPCISNPNFNFLYILDYALIVFSHCLCLVLFSYCCR